MVNSFTFDARNVEFKSFKLATYEYLTPKYPKALLFFVEDYGDCCLNYGYFFKKFVDNGIRIFCFDRRGFGQS